MFYSKKNNILKNNFLWIFFFVILFSIFQLKIVSAKDFLPAKIKHYKNIKVNENRIIKTKKLFQGFIDEISKTNETSISKNINFLRTKETTIKDIENLSFSPLFSKENEYLLKGLKAFSEGYYGLSLNYGKKILSINEKSGSGNFLISLSLEKTKNYKESLLYMKNSIKYMRYAPEIYKAAALLFNKLDKKKEALKYAKLSKNYDYNSVKSIIKESKKNDKKIISKKIDYFKKYKFKERFPIKKSEKNIIIKIGISTKKGKTIGRKSMRFKSISPINIFEKNKSCEIKLSKNKIHKAIIENNSLKINEEHIMKFPVTFVCETSSIAIENIAFGQGYPWAGYETREYRGKIILKRKNNRFIIINEIDMEEYLAGVIPAEMPYHYPIEALKAQAIAARSEATRKFQHKRHSKYGYDLCDDVCCQAYRGSTWEKQSTNMAVNQTSDLVLYGNNKIIDSVYSSCCGGITQSSVHLQGWGKNSYLTSVKDNPHKTKNNSFSFLNNGNDDYCHYSSTQHRWVRIIEKKIFLRNLEKKHKLNNIITILPIKRNHPDTISKNPYFTKTIVI
jgi:hypothetical protein